MKSVIEFQHGGKTCAVEKDKFCRFETVSGFGTRFECGLFGERLHFVDGWLNRCGKCLSEFGENGNALEKG